MRPNLALEAALAVSRAPNMVRQLRRQPLPSGITLLLQMLSGDSHALNEVTRLAGLDENEVTVVVELYVLRVMLFRGASPRRVLGVEEGAERGQIRRHMGYLMGWLHPDKSGNAWRVAFSRRVMEAWRQMDGGAEAYEPRPPSRQRRQNPKPLFVLPWVSLPAEQQLWNRILDWKKRLRPWRSV
jgi:hypothetical protein